MVAARPLPTYDKYGVRITLTPNFLDAQYAAARQFELGFSSYLFLVLACSSLAPRMGQVPHLRELRSSNYDKK